MRRSLSSCLLWLMACGSAEPDATTPPTDDTALPGSESAESASPEPTTEPFQVLFTSLSAGGELSTRRYRSDTGEAEVFAPGYFVLVRHADGAGYLARAVGEPKGPNVVLAPDGHVVHAGIESTCVPLLVDIDTVLGCETVPPAEAPADGAADPATDSRDWERVVRWDLAVGRKEVVGEPVEALWDDVPLRYGGDQQSVVFSQLGSASVPGGRVAQVALDTGETTTFAASARAAEFSPSGARALVAMRNESGRSVSVLELEDGAVNGVSSIEPPADFATFVDDRRAVVLRTSRNEGGRRFALSVRDLVTGDEQRVSGDAAVGELSTFGFAALTPSGDELVFVGKEDASSALLAAPLGGGGSSSSRTLLSGLGEGTTCAILEVTPLSTEPSG